MNLLLILNCNKHFTDTPDVRLVQRALLISAAPCKTPKLTLLGDGINR